MVIYPVERFRTNTWSKIPKAWRLKILFESVLQCGCLIACKVLLIKYGLFLLINKVGCRF